MNSENNLKELKEVLDFAFGAVEAFNKAAEDGKFNLLDLQYLYPLWDKAAAAIKDIGNPLQRFLALTPQERQDLLSYVKLRFEIEDKELEYLIEDTLSALGSNVNLVKRWSSRFKKPNPETEA